MASSSSPVSASAVQAARHLRIVVGRIRRSLREAYDPEELSMSQISVLTRLLAERGLIERGPDPNDGRRTVVSLSSTGRASVGDKRAAGEEWLARTLQNRFTEAEREQLISAMELLDRLTD
jgi:Winged helix DNA-binding domain